MARLLWSISYRLPRTLSCLLNLPQHLFWGAAALTVTMVLCRFHFWMLIHVDHRPIFEVQKTLFQTSFFLQKHVPRCSKYSFVLLSCATTSVIAETLRLHGGPFPGIDRWGRRVHREIWWNIIYCTHTLIRVDYANMKVLTPSARSWKGFR